MLVKKKNDIFNFLFFLYSISKINSQKYISFSLSEGQVMIYGYIRVSTDKQDCENQKIGIEAKAKSLKLKIDRYIKDAGISGITEPNERALGGCLSRLKKGDIIICSELSRLGRKLFMIMRILEHCMNCGAKVYTVKDGYELGDNLQSKVMAFAFGLSAEIERELISLRTKEAIARMKEEGRLVGRRPGKKNASYKIDKYSELVLRLLENNESKRAIARRIRVSVPTVYHFIERAEYGEI